MKFRVKDLENYLLNKIDWKEISEMLTNKAFESSYQDGILDVDILPNRFPDAGSLIGISKEISLLANIKAKEPKIKIKETPKNIKSFVKVINQTDKAPFYFGRIVLNVKNQKSPDWLKEFVEFYGLNSVNLLVDLANFAMFEYNAPIHIFDLDKIKNKSIFVRESKKGEKFFSLEGKEYILDQGNIVIADKEKILALAGIKGSKVAEVDLNTKNIFIEAAVFDPQIIYQTSRKFSILTEASFRFERRVIPERTLKALERLTSLIQKFAGGEVLKNIINAERKKPLWIVTYKEKKIPFNYERMKKYLGVEILKKLALGYLEKIKKLQPERIDIQNEEDLYEEILRIYGTDKIKKELENPLHPANLDKKIKFNYFIQEKLLELGYNEIYIYNLISKKDKEIFSELSKEPVMILNPISENFKYYQFTLLPNLLKAVNLNQRIFKEIKIFNISKTAHLEQKTNAYSVFEKYTLGIIYAGKNREEVLKELKGCLTYLLLRLQIENPDFQNKKFEFSNLASEILINKDSIGIIGLFSKKINEIYDIDLDVGFIELNLEKLINLYHPYKEFVYFGDYPTATRDISFFVEKKLNLPEILKTIKKEKIENLKNIETIDIYFPKDRPDKKSITLRFIFQNPKRTLTDEEVEKEIKKVIDILKENFKAEIR